MRTEKNYMIISENEEVISEINATYSSSVGKYSESIDSEVVRGGL